MIILKSLMVTKYKRFKWSCPLKHCIYWSIFYDVKDNLICTFSFLMCNYIWHTGSFGKLNTCMMAKDTMDDLSTMDDLRE